MSKPTGNKYLLKMQLFKVLRESTPKMESVEQLERFETDLERLRSAGKIDDKNYLEFMKNIAQAKKLLEAQEVTGDV